EHLVMRQRCLVRPGEEIVDRDLTLTGRAASQTYRVQHRADGCEVLGRVGLTKRSPDSASVAHDGIGDDTFGVAEDGTYRRQLVRRQCFAVTRHRTDPHQRRIDDDVAELGHQVVDVDEVLRVGYAQFHHGQQTVAAGHEQTSATHPAVTGEG